MLALLLSPIYILFNVYAVRRILQWISAWHASLATKQWWKWCVAALYAVPALSPALAYLLPASPFQRGMGVLSSAWLGCFFYLLGVLFLADGIAFFIRRLFPKALSAERKKKMLVCSGAICTAVVIAICGFGFWHAQQLEVVLYRVQIEKDCADRDSLRIALVSDLHFGYSVGLEQARRLVDTINSQDPDLICIAGDVFDNAYTAIEDPQALSEILSGLRSRYGVFACYGNHDVSERLLAGFSFGGGGTVSEARMDAILTDAGIRLLRDEVVCVDGSFYVVGRRDRTKPGVTAGRASPQELLDGLDLALPVIVLDHQPYDLAALAESGADLMLSGHTHNGQLFPGNLLMRLFWENSYGLLQKDGMTSIVTSGAGVWGPAMRVGTDCEVAVIDVDFAEKR